MNPVELRLTPETRIDRIGRITLGESIGGHIPGDPAAVGSNSNCALSGEPPALGKLEIEIVFKGQRTRQALIHRTCRGGRRLRISRERGATGGIGCSPSEPGTP